MKESHIIQDPPLMQNSILIDKDDNEDFCNIEQYSQFESLDFAQQKRDIIRVVLNLDRELTEA